MYTLSGKPNSIHDSADGEEDGMLNTLYLLHLAVIFIFCIIMKGVITLSK